MAEKRKIFNRICKRCEKSYETTGKFSKICDNCKLPNGGNHTNKFKRRLKNG